MLRKECTKDEYLAKYLPREIGGELIMYENLLMEGPGQALSGQPDQLGLVRGEPHSRVQLVRRYNVGALITVVVPEEIVERNGEIKARHDVDVRQKDVLSLAVLARQISHVILRINVSYPPIGLLAGYTVREFVQSGLRLSTIDDFRQIKHTRLFLGGSRFGHRQGKDHSLPDGLVASPQIHQIPLQNLKLLVTGGIQRHRHRPGPMQSDLHQRV